jgi:hypothetical protein
MYKELFEKINFDQSKKYGILLSGGIDSAVLLYLLLKEYPNIDLQPFTIPKSDGAIMYAPMIVKHFNKKFDLTIPDTIAVGDPTVHHRLQSKTAVNEIFQKYAIDFLFIALNQNPPELNNLPGAPFRSRKSINPKVLLPFVDLLKTDILSMMFEYNQEDIAEITHSCTEQQVGRCGNCWQCTERAWAFSKLNKQDTGIK